MRNNLNIIIVGTIEGISEIPGKNGTFFEYTVKDSEGKVWNVVNFESTHEQYDITTGAVFAFECYVKSREYSDKNGNVSHFLSLSLKSITVLGEEIYKYEYTATKPKGNVVFQAKKIEAKTVSQDEISDYE